MTSSPAVAAAALTAFEGTKPPAGGETAGPERSPVRKKTRFMTDGGIREAGKESLAGPPPALGLATAAKMHGRRRVVPDDGEDDSDDDDDLIIVK